MGASGFVEYQIIKEGNKETIFKKEVCDGEIHFNGFKGCLNEFSPVSTVGWLLAIAGLIAFWKYLNNNSKK